MGFLNSLKLHTYIIPILIIIYCFIYEPSIYSQELPWDVKQHLIDYLDSTDVSGVITSIDEYNVSEAKEKIEQVFWNSNLNRYETKHSPYFIYFINLILILLRNMHWHL